MVTGKRTVSGTRPTKAPLNQSVCEIGGASNNLMRAAAQRYAMRMDRKSNTYFFPNPALNPIACQRGGGLVVTLNGPGPMFFVDC
jgi:hypothetical protein